MSPNDFFDAMRYFGDPKIPDGSNAAVITRAYLGQLEPYGSEVLELAAETLLKTRKHRNFPLPEECRRACVEAQNELAERRMAGKPRKKSSDPWSQERIKLADRLMHSDIGRLSADEGWIVHLHDWCRENQRLPNAYESEKVRRKGLEIKMERDRLSGQSAGNRATMRIMQSIGRAMEKKRHCLETLAKENSGEGAV